MTTQVAPRRKKRSGTRRAPARRGTPAQRTGTGREIVGVCLIALAAFLALTLYAGLATGPVGAGLEDLVRLLIGRLVVLAPLLMVAAGILLILNHPLLRSRSFLAGSGLMIGALTLALAGGLLGLPGPSRSSWFESATMMDGGGVIGEALYRLTSATVRDVGSALIVLLSLVSGAILVSGASLEVLLRRSSAGAATASRRVGHGMANATEVAVRGGQALRVRVLPKTEDLPLRARTGGVEPLDGASQFPDIFDEPPVLPTSPALGADVEDGGEVDLAGDPGFIEPEPDPLVFEPDDDVLLAEPEPEPEPELITTPADAVTAAGGVTRFTTPPVSLLRKSEGPERMPAAIIEDTSTRLVEALGHFGIEAQVSDAVSGPRVTRYELRLAPGTKIGRVSALRDDIAYSLAARDEIRVIAPIPGKRAVGVEVPNPEARLVTLGDLYRGFPAEAGPLVTWLGLDISGKPIYVDLAKMPHLLIAGSTGTGKSVCLNALLASILLRATPDELRLILIDPKKVELNHYESIPHLLTPVVTRMKDAAAVLANIVREMENRYELMGLSRARNLRDWNAARVAQGDSPMPTVLVVIDELADLMMVAPAEVEDAIIRLAQKSRAVGIHLVLATQRPSADVITGMIKANVPSRVAFAVSSQVDSRVILDAGGAESLLGGGDMLFRPVGSSRLQRLQGAYVSEDEIQAITDAWREQGRPALREELMERPDGPENRPDADRDEMLEHAVELVVQQGTASVSLLQRRLGVGYARAGRLVDAMEQLGVVSGHEGSKPRSVLIGPGEVDRVLGRTPAADEDDEVAATDAGAGGPPVA